MRVKSTSPRSSEPADAPAEVHAHPEQSRLARVPWHPLRAALFTIALYLAAPITASLLLGVFIAVGGMPAGTFERWLNDSTGGQFAFMLISQGLILGGLALFLRWNKRGFGVLGLTRPKAADFWYTLAGYGVYFVAYSLLFILVSALVPAIDTAQEQQIGFDSATGVLALTMVFVSLVVLPPLVEELLMRGLLYTSFRKYLAPLAATLLTSILFAVAHLQIGAPGAAPLWIAAIDTFVLSLILCHLRERTGRLWACIGVHALKNAVAFSLLFVFNVRA